MPLFSVIIPIYKTEEYLPRCIESILNQTINDFELILVDDGSPDNCGAICDSYAAHDCRIKVIHQANVGVSQARNRGIEIASGTYIVFVDSDDWAEANYLLELSKPMTDFVGNSFSIYDESGNLIKQQDILPYEGMVKKENVLRLLKEGTLGYTISKRFSTKIIKENGVIFEEKINHTEDTLFILDYLEHAQTATIECKANYAYVRYSTRSTLSNQATLERLAMVCVANEMICKKFYPQNCEAYKELFYSRIGYNYMAYIDRIWHRDIEGVINRYLWINNLIRNEDIIKILKYAPNAIWKLSLSERCIMAIQQGSRMRILLSCFLDALMTRKKNYGKKR